MKPAQFTALAAEIFGTYSWKINLAKKHNVNVSTVYRWGRGEIPIPQAAIDELHKAAARKIVTLQKSLG